MPNIDGGHYFLTVLVPIRVSAEVEADGAVESPANALRKLLALMPTVGDAAGVGDDPAAPRISPFARNRLNHFVRFAVIDAINYNGRINGNGLIEAIRRINPAIPQKFDRLSRSFLLFAAEFDANPHGAPEPDVYLDTLWDTMEPELRAIFGFCYRFADVKNAGDFVRYIKRCQIETSMPFNDYWITPPPLEPISGALLAGVPLALLTAISALLWWQHAGPGPWTIGLIAGVAVAVAVAVGLVVRHGARPFPTAPRSTLACVLKALYLQNVFVDFAVAHQGEDAATLYDAFGAFLAAHRPSAASPSQAPGVIGA